MLHDSKWFETTDLSRKVLQFSMRKHLLLRELTTSACHESCGSLVLMFKEVGYNPLGDSDFFFDQCL